MPEIGGETVKIEILVLTGNPEDKTNIDCLKKDLQATVTIQGDKLLVALIQLQISNNEHFEIR